MFCIVGLRTFFLLDNSSDRDVLKGYLFVNGKHLHEAFQGKSALKQGAAIQLQTLGKMHPAPKEQPQAEVAFGRFQSSMFAVFVQLSFSSCS